MHVTHREQVQRRLGAKTKPTKKNKDRGRGATQTIWDRNSRRSFHVACFFLFAVIYMMICMVNSTVFIYHHIIICALLRNKALQVSLWTKQCNSMALLRWWFAFGQSRLAMLCSLFHDFTWPCWICSICLHGHVEVELNHKSGSICYAWNF